MSEWSIVNECGKCCYVCLRSSTFVYVCDGEGVRGGGVCGGAYL